MTLVQASFRAATLQETQEQRGGLLWQWASAIGGTAARMLGTAALLRHLGDTLALTEPLPIRGYYAVTWLLGLSPYRQFVWSLPSFRKVATPEGGQRLVPHDVYFLEGNRNLLTAFFDHHRHGDLFAPTPNMEQLARFLTEAAGIAAGVEVPNILTCDVADTPALRAPLLAALKGERLQESVDAMQTIASQLQEACCAPSQAADGQPDAVDIIPLTRRYVAKVMGLLLFDDPAAGEASTDAIQGLKLLAAQTLKGPLDAVQQRQLTDYQTALRGQIDALLAKKETLPLWQCHSAGSRPLDDATLRALIATALFAGQDTSATLLQSTLLLLARDREAQSALYEQLLGADDSDRELNKALDKVIARALYLTPPAAGVGRHLKVDSVLEFIMQSELPTGHLLSPSRVFFPAGSTLVARIGSFAKLAGEGAPAEGYEALKPFGHGVHRCPGEALVRTELRAFLKVLLRRYRLEATGASLRAIPQGRITLEFAGPLPLVIKPRLAEWRQGPLPLAT